MTKKSVASVRPRRSSTVTLFAFRSSIASRAAPRLSGSPVRAAVRSAVWRTACCLSLTDLSLVETGRRTVLHLIEDAPGHGTDVGAEHPGGETDETITRPVRRHQRGPQPLGRLRRVGVRDSEANHAWPGSQPALQQRQYPGDDVVA